VRKRLRGNAVFVSQESLVGDEDMQALLDEVRRKFDDVRGTQNHG